MKHIVLGLIVSFFAMGAKAQIPHAYGQMGSQYGGYGVPHGVCPWQTTANRTITNGTITSLKNEKKDLENQLADLRSQNSRENKRIKEAKRKLGSCFNSDGKEVIEDYIESGEIEGLLNIAVVSQPSRSIASTGQVSEIARPGSGGRVANVQQTTGREICIDATPVPKQVPLPEMVQERSDGKIGVYIANNGYLCDKKDIVGDQYRLVAKCFDENGSLVSKSEINNTLGASQSISCGDREYGVQTIGYTDKGKYIERLKSKCQPYPDIDVPTETVIRPRNEEYYCDERTREQETVPDLVPNVFPSDEQQFITNLCSGKDSSLMGRKCKAGRRSNKREISATKCENLVGDWLDSAHERVTEDEINGLEVEIQELELAIQKETQDALQSGNYITQASSSSSSSSSTKSNKTFDNVLGYGLPILGAATGYLLGKSQDKRNGINANRMGFPYNGGQLAGQYAVAGGMLGLNVASSALARGSYGCGGRMYGNVGPSGVYGQGYPFITGGMPGPFGYGNIGIGGQVGIPPYGMSPYGMMGMGGNPYGSPYGAGSPFGVGGLGIGVGINGNAGGPFGAGGYGSPYGGIYGQGGLGGPGGYGNPYGMQGYGAGNPYGVGGLGVGVGINGNIGGPFGAGGYGSPYGGIYGQGGLGGPGGYGSPYGGVYGQGGLGGQGGYGPYGQGGYGQAQYQAMQQYQQQLQAQQQAQIAYQRNQQQRYQAAAQMQQQIQMLNQQMNQILYSGGAGGYAPGGSYGYGGGLNVGFQVGGGIGGGYGPLLPGGQVQNPIGGPIQQPGLPVIQGPAPGQFPTSGPQQQPGQLPGNPNVSFPGR